MGEEKSQERICERLSALEHRCGALENSVKTLAAVQTRYGEQVVYLNCEAAQRKLDNDRKKTKYAGACSKCACFLLESDIHRRGDSMFCSDCVATHDKAVASEKEEPAEGTPNLDVLKCCLDHVLRASLHRNDNLHPDQYRALACVLDNQLRAALGDAGIESFIAAAGDELCDREMAQVAAERLDDPEAKAMPFAEARERMAKELREDEAKAAVYRFCQDQAEDVVARLNKQTSEIESTPRAMTVRQKSIEQSELDKALEELEAIGWPCRLAELPRKYNELSRRSRWAAQTLIEVIGAPGPENVDETARRAAERLKLYERTLRCIEFLHSGDDIATLVHGVLEGNADVLEDFASDVPRNKVTDEDVQ